MANTYVSPEPDIRIDGDDAATERIEKDFLSAPVPTHRSSHPVAKDAGTET
ncbi:hypothetical protein [Streptomyces sp. NPDC059893]|uniref:hypothetical protein n=1 Tax=Streptomyces sp. NPDC059893 TaxID=3346990 RepID=UPI00365858B4